MSNTLPNDLINRLKANTSLEHEALVTMDEQEEKNSSIYINPAKDFDLSHLAIDNRIPWCTKGYYLQKQPYFVLDPLYHAGCYYLQAASSMFLDHIIRQLGLNQQPIRAIDVSADRGGISILLNSVLHSDSLLVANEIINTRVKLLQKTLVRWGNPNVVITNNDSSAFTHLPGYFDLMVMDTPSSGRGIYPKDRSVIDKASLANVTLCSERQKRIIASCQTSLKTDGYFVYSICSSWKEETGDILDWLIDEFQFESVPIPIKDIWAVEKRTSDRHQATAYRFHPHKAFGQGLFIAVLKKKSEQSTFSLTDVVKEINSTPQYIAKDWLQADDLYSFMHLDMLHVFPRKYKIDFTALSNVLHIKNAGIQIGKLVDNEFIPSHDLALSSLIRKDINAIELNIDDAYKYLRKETLDDSINVNEWNGWVLIQYKGVNLGWIKTSENKIDNYYPEELRIASL